jgi:hypothetical protein
MFRRISRVLLISKTETNKFVPKCRYLYSIIGTKMKKIYWVPQNWRNNAVVRC